MKGATSMPNLRTAGTKAATERWATESQTMASRQGSPWPSEACPGLVLPARRRRSLWVKAS
eukprot:8232588-Lingulodinium_polyedra.AAC.1